MGEYNCKCIHQGILMVGGKNKMIVEIYIFSSYGYYFPVIDTIMPEPYCFFKQGIALRIFFNVLFSHTIS